MRKTRAQQIAEYAKRDRMEAIAILGGKCARCGITYPLDIDHVNNDGNIEQIGVARKTPVRRAISAIRSGHNNGRYQLLCKNCNYLKSWDPEEYARPPTWKARP